MIRFRQAKTEDLQIVVSITCNAIAYMQDNGIDQWDDRYPDQTILLNDIKKQEMVLVECDGITVGFLTLNNKQSPEYASVNWKQRGRIMVIHRLTIEPTHQGKGLAFRMMDHAENMARQSGTEIIRLDAYSQNPAANSLYEKRGYHYAGSVTFRKGIFYCYEKHLNSDARI
ncbi:GNAT family N-acetyltransferase [Desulfosediminicola flagellatus]|uniref:GNAT family N-acetyltransferase n=1 Tax=Desulfosediminicola flagellatus TaxID=2569541 RepID=UPI0010AC3910|nr:GNAT family N-acetyltransferase [Desulfosediminicola flagellatus]